MTFSPESLSPTETQRANFSFIREAGDKNIQLSLEVVNPTQFISQVNVDSLSDGLSPSLTLQLKDDLGKSYVTKTLHYKTLTSSNAWILEIYCDIMTNQLNLGTICKRLTMPISLTVI